MGKYFKPVQFRGRLIRIQNEATKPGVDVYKRQILQDLGEVLPGTGRYHGQTVHSGLDLVKILGTDIQIADDSAADTVFQRIGLPCFITKLKPFRLGTS